jgi:hypothetical protein
MIDISGDANRLHIRTWRMKAEELRTIADGMMSDHTRHLLLNAAANYERMADQAEKHDKPEASRFRFKTS